MIRSAVPADVPAILRLIRELAAYEREPDAVEATPQRLREALFPAAGDPAAYALVCDATGADGAGPTGAERIGAGPIGAERIGAGPIGAERIGAGRIDGSEVVGMALWFPTFSTWTGRQGMWLEDLYVEPAHRGAGHGRALLVELARECVRRGWPRLEWTVLDWNAPALAFYRTLGAGGMTEWTTHRVSGAALDALAAGSAPTVRPGDFSPASPSPR